jgi:hypothetical protein
MQSLSDLLEEALGSGPCSLGADLEAAGRSDDIAGSLEADLAAALDESASAAGAGDQDRLEEAALVAVDSSDDARPAESAIAPVHHRLDVACPDPSALETFIEDSQVLLCDQSVELGVGIERLGVAFASGADSEDVSSEALASALLRWGARVGDIPGTSPADRRQRHWRP